MSDHRPARTPLFVAAGRAWRWLLALPLPALLLGCAALSLAIDLVTVRPYPFWADESYSVLAARAPTWSHVLWLNLRNEETPPIYFMLLRLWGQLWHSTGPTSLRLFSAVALAVSVPLVGWLGLRLRGRTVGLVAALLVAINPFAHYYGLEVRAYTVVLAVTALLLVLAHRYQSTPQPLTWAAYVVAGGVALYTSYFIGFELLAVALAVSAVLLRRWWRDRRAATLRPLLGWALAQPAILVQLWPWLPALHYQRVVQATTNAPDARLGLVKYVLSVVVLGANVPDQSWLSWTVFAVVGMALAVAGWWLVRQRRSAAAVWLAALVGLPLLCMLPIVRNQFAPRYALFTLPGYAILLAAALTAPGRSRWLRQPLLVALIVSSALYSLTRLPSRERRGGWPAVGQAVAAQSQPGDALFFAPQWSQPAFELQAPPLPLALPRYGTEDFAAHYYEQHRSFRDPIDAAGLAQHLCGGGRAWIVWDRTSALQPQLPPAATATRQSFGTTDLWLVTAPRC